MCRCYGSCTLEICAFKLYVIPFVLRVHQNSALNDNTGCTHANLLRRILGRLNTCKCCSRFDIDTCAECDVNFINWLIATYFLIKMWYNTIIFNGGFFLPRFPPHGPICVHWYVCTFRVCYFCYSIYFANHPELILCKLTILMVNLFFSIHLLFPLYLKSFQARGQTCVFFYLAFPALNNSFICLRLGNLNA